MSGLHRGEAEAPQPLLLPLLPLPPLLLCVPAGPVFEGSEKMPLQGSRVCLANTRPGAVRHSTAAATHRAQASSSLSGSRAPTTTPQHASRASAVIHAYPATALHAWGTVSPPICHVRAPETCPSEACEREKKDCQGKSEGEGGRLGGEGALNSPPRGHRRSGHRRFRVHPTKNELVVLDSRRS